MNRTVWRRLLLVATLAGLLVTLAAGAASAHEERPAYFPSGEHGPAEYREPLSEPYVVVCKDNGAGVGAFEDRFAEHRDDLLAACADEGFEHIQDAVFDVRDNGEQGSTIYVLPGTYREEPYRERPDCADEVEGNPEGGEGNGSGAPLSYNQHVECPHAQNLIAILGQDENRASDEDPNIACENALCDLQIEGVGADAEDVIIEGGFHEEGVTGGTEEDYAEGRFLKLNGIRADRADGIYMRNFTTQLFEFNAVYVIETDGFTVDETVTRWNDEYGWLTFAVDHGLYTDCEGYGNGDSAMYPGSASDLYEGEDGHLLRELDRPAVEITGCRAWGNALGYSGTAGNAVYVHDNDFFGNQTGIAMDSLFPDHPGLPQSHSRFENNRIYGNNVNFVEAYIETGICDLPFSERGYEHGVVCPVVPLPAGTGVMVAGGNWNLFADNDVYDNWRFGFKLFHVPAALRDEPENEGDTSHHNEYSGNRMGFAPEDRSQPNGMDLWWDDQGEGNCWQDNTSVTGEFTHNAVDPRGLPTCDDGGSPGIPLNAAKSAQIAACATYDRNDNPNPTGCDWMESPDEPEDREPSVPAACPADTPAAPFTDREHIHQVHLRSVDCITHRDVAAGYADNTYRPGNAVRRDHMAAFIVRALDEAEGAEPAPPAEESDDEFDDIDDSTHEAAIQRAFAAGITEGVTPTRYGPALPIRRAQLATFVLRAYAHGTGQDVDDLASDEQAFDDVGPDNVHFRFVNGAAELGLVRGRSATTFEPSALTSRDQMATLLASLLTELEDEAGLPSLP